MMLNRNRSERFLKALQALGPCEFRTQDVYPLGVPLRMSPITVRKTLSQLEKTDHLVRLAFGVYITMDTYMAHPEWYR